MNRKMGVVMMAWSFVCIALAWYSSELPGAAKSLIEKGSIVRLQSMIDHGALDEERLLAGLAADDIEAPPPATDGHIGSWSLAQWVTEWGAHNFAVITRPVWMAWLLGAAISLTAGVRLWSKPTCTCSPAPESAADPARSAGSAAGS